MLGYVGRSGVGGEGKRRVLMVEAQEEGRRMGQLRLLGGEREITLLMRESQELCSIMELLCLGGERDMT